MGLMRARVFITYIEAFRIDGTSNWNSIMLHQISNISIRNNPAHKPEISHRYNAFRIQTLVTPILKKPNADIESKNFRPVSNLPLLSKVIERIVIDQMSGHCDTHNLTKNSNPRIVAITAQKQRFSK